MRAASKFVRIAILGLSVLTLLVIGNGLGFARDKNETIDATAEGTGTQMGRNFGITIIIYDWSTPADGQILTEAYQKGQNNGLSSALQKMKAVGHISITGTLGYDISYIKLTQTSTGCHIIFVTNRKLRFGEVWADTPSTSYDLTAGEIDLNEQDKSKSTGALYPEAQLVLDSKGQLQWDLNRNPWKLVDIIDWKGTPGLN